MVTQMHRECLDAIQKLITLIDMMVMSPDLIYLAGAYTSILRSETDTMITEHIDPGVDPMEVRGLDALADQIRVRDNSAERLERIRSIMLDYLYPMASQLDHVISQADAPTEKIS